MRLFLAISIEGAMQDSLLKLQHHWRYIGVRGDFVSAENMHLTLAFIGEYGNPDVVMDAISSVSFTPFTIQLDGAGTFHDTLWTGISPNESLSACVRQLRRALVGQESPMTAKNSLPISPWLEELRLSAAWISCCSNFRQTPWMYLKSRSYVLTVGKMA